MICDLHLHSNYSDSSRSIEEVFRLAKEKNVECISIVDHDTTETYEEAKKFQEKYKIKLIPGIEISAYDYKRNKKVHLLGYNYSKNPINIEKIGKETLKKRHYNSLRQLRVIEENDYEIDYSKLVTSKNRQKTLYKQHIMYSLNPGDFESKKYQDLYKFLFKGDGIANFEIDYIDVFDGLEAIIKDGGIPVLAHPGELDSFELVPELVDKGLLGIEVYHPSHSTEDIKKSIGFSKKYNLIKTGGSDNHGIFGKEVPIGNVKLDKETLNILKVNLS